MPKRGKTLGKIKSKKEPNVKKLSRIATDKFEKFRLNFSKLSSVTELL